MSCVRADAEMPEFILPYASGAPAIGERRRRSRLREAAFVTGRVSNGADVSQRAALPLGTTRLG